MDLQFDIERLQQQMQRLRIDESAQPGDAERHYFHYYGLDFERRMSGVAHHFGHFSSGKHEIVCHYFALTTEQPRATCFLFHGYFDHAGLFSHLIGHCLLRGFNVVIYDLPGHGLSTGERASIGSFSEYETVLSDCLALFDGIAPKPWHALAQSTGCAVLMDYLLLQPPVFERAVLLAPLVRAAEWRWVKVAHWLSHRFVDSVPRRFGVNSGDRDFLQFVAHRDPLQPRQIPVRWVEAMLRWERRFEQLPNSEQQVLVVQGQKDNTVDWRHNIPLVREKFARAKYLPLQEAHHHLVNETLPIRAKIFAAIDLYLG